MTVMRCDGLAQLSPELRNLNCSQKTGVRIRNTFEQQCSPSKLARFLDRADTEHRKLQCEAGKWKALCDFWQ